MTLYDVAQKIYRKYYMPKWRRLISFTVMDLLHAIEWAKKRRVFFWQEVVKKYGMGRAGILIGMLTSAQLVFSIRYEKHRYRERIYYSVYVYNEAAEEFWDSSS